VALGGAASLTVPAQNVMWALLLSRVNSMRKLALASGHEIVWASVAATGGAPWTDAAVAMAATAAAEAARLMCMGIGTSKGRDVHVVCGPHRVLGQ
jgi:hypothetical protein